MVILGVDAHKRSHTVVAVEETGRRLASFCAAATSDGHLAILRWAAQFAIRRWAVEDCRHLAGNLERDLLAAGEEVLRVPPKLMANARDGARTYGKSDPIDALAVARAALREPDLPTARLDGPARDIRLLVDHRDRLVAERTAKINRLRWHLHQLETAWDPPTRSLSRRRHLAQVEERLRSFEGVVAVLARELVADIVELTTRIDRIEAELRIVVTRLAPTLLAIPGCGALTAAKIVGEVAGVDRFRSKDAFARHNGTAPIPCWSGGRNERVRLSRVGNRQLNRALHTIALTQARRHRDAQVFLERRRSDHHDPPRAALRALKRRLSDVVYRSLLADLHLVRSEDFPAAA